MNDKDPATTFANRLSESELPFAPRENSPGTCGTRFDNNRQPRKISSEPKQVRIVVNLTLVASQTSEAAKPVAEIPAMYLARRHKMNPTRPYIKMLKINYHFPITAGH